MASIIKRKNSYSVVYTYTDESGETKQKWETWHTHKDALRRKAEVENQMNNGTFLPPNNQKVSDFLYDFVTLYGEKRWGVSVYDSRDCPQFCVNTPKVKIERNLKGSGGKPFPLASY